MTIPHEIARDEVMAYLDGELTPARAVAVRDHLDRCAACSALADDLRRVSSSLSDWQAGPAPDRLVAPAGAARDRSSSDGGWKTWLMSPSFFGLSKLAIVTASAVIIVVLVFSGQALQRRPGAEFRGPLADMASRNGALESAPAVATKSTAADELTLNYASAGAAGRPSPAPSGAAGDVSTLVTGGVAVQTGGADATQMVVRTAAISLSTETFDDMRPGLEKLAAAHHGSVAALTLAGDPPNRRTLNATMRVPVAELDATLAGVRALGKVLQESQSSEDVTDAHRDLAIRIANAKVEEARLDEILKDRTGKLSDVLAVEQAQSRVRTEIEQMEAEELAMRNRAALSTITVDVAERYQAELVDTNPVPIGARLRNALVDGARFALDSIVSLVLTALGAGPAVLVWTAILFWPVRWIWRRLRRGLAPPRIVA